MRRSIIILLGCALLICITISVPAAGQESPSAGKSATTLENLHAAYADAAAAPAMFTAYAAKADEEGYHQVASLFRAVARAEEAHAANYAERLKEKGITPRAETPVVEVKSTLENLEAAVTSKDNNKNVRYPSYIRQAKKDKDKDAEQCFNYSRVSESEHAAIFDQALNDLDAYKGGAQNFVVCPVCGKTTVLTRNPKCPRCSTPSEKFVVVK